MQYNSGLVRSKSGRNRSKCDRNRSKLIKMCSKLCEIGRNLAILICSWIFDKILVTRQNNFKKMQFIFPTRNEIRTMFVLICTNRVLKKQKPIQRLVKIGFWISNPLSASKSIYIKKNTSNDNVLQVLL